LDDFKVKQKRVLIFIVAYNAERTIQEVIRRVPASLTEYETEILIIDDSSHDGTFDKARSLRGADNLPFPLRVLFNPVNQGYGGNQKIGFHYAIEKEFDFVALVHGDGQYAPECLEELLQPLLTGEADAAFGSRMMLRGNALRGGMPLYKYVGNKILTSIQNRLLGTNFSEFHSGYRLYSVAALKRIPFEKNTNQFHFDTEIFIQLVRAGCRIKEQPIPTYYGDEICHVDGLKYAKDVIKATLLARAQDFGILYDPKYDVTGLDNGGPYEPKLEFASPHTFALARVPPGAKVLDIGCASGYVSRALHAKGCEVTGVDQFPPSSNSGLKDFIQADLSEGPLPVDPAQFDYILALDVIEHLKSPEGFAAWLRQCRPDGVAPMVITSTGNIAFLIVRLMLLFGFFHYGRRGILDLTHTRLFTFSTFRKLFEQSGFRVHEVVGVPAPFPLALGEGALARGLLKINSMAMFVSKRLFSYQIFMVVQPLPTLDNLLKRTMDATESRAGLSVAAGNR
jgi:glycosyltransferase involved in cell wall biosynthesis